MGYAEKHKSLVKCAVCGVETKEVELKILNGKLQWVGKHHSTKESK